MSRRWTEEEIKFVKQNASLLSNKELSSRLVRSESAIKNFLHTLNLPNRQNLWSNEEDELLCSLYKNKLDKQLLQHFPNRTRLSVHTRATCLGLTDQQIWDEKEIQILKEGYATTALKDLVKLLPNRTKKTILNRASVLGVSQPFGEKQRIYVDDAFFTKLTILNCYYAGLLAADGNISGNNITISLQRGDKYYLEVFAYHLDYAGNIKDYTKLQKSGFVSHFSTLSFTSKKIVEDLERHFYLIPNKTFILKSPNITDTDMIKAFIIGLYDGDGSIVKAIDNRDRLILYGCQALLEWVKSIFDSLYSSHRYTSKVNKSNRSNSYTYEVSGERATRIITDLKKIDVPHFVRKWGK